MERQRSGPFQRESFDDPVPIHEMDDTRRSRSGRIFLGRSLSLLSSTRRWAPPPASWLFAILNRYFDRPSALPLQELNGRPNYYLGPVKFAAAISVFWGIAGFTVGLLIASQLAWPVLNFDLPWTSFGRLRPLHTSAVIFAFGGNVLIATSFYVVQKTCRVRLAGDLAPWFVVLGYNFFIVIAGTGYLLGVTQSKEYAEPEWYADLWLTIVWVTYLGPQQINPESRKDQAHCQPNLRMKNPNAILIAGFPA
jgi:hypothetical protein